MWNGRRGPEQTHNILAQDDSGKSSKSRQPMRLSVRMVLVCVV
jgi:hypothetical protein